MRWYQFTLRSRTQVLFWSDSIIFYPFPGVVFFSNLCEVNSEAPKAEMEDIPINKRTCRSKASSPCIQEKSMDVNGETYVEWILNGWVDELI